MKLRRAALPALALAAWGLAPPSLLAQRQAGSVVGRVSDDKGAPLARASVTLAGPRGAATTFTDSGGEYRFPAVDPGTYEVKADLAGLGAQLRQGVVVAIAKQTTASFALQVASMEVAVAVAPPPVDVTSSSFDHTLDQALLFQMPFERTALHVVNKAPGVRDDSGYGGDAERANALLLDGVEFRDPSSGDPFVFLNYNWLDQVQVMGPGAPAEYGLFTGAIFNSVTRSGGNRHAGLFDVLVSPSRSLERTEASQDPDRTSRYLDVSGQLSGPLVRDKLFFFLGAQRRRIETDPGGPRSLATNTTPRLAAKLDYRPGPDDELSALLESDRADLTGLGAVDADELTTEVDSPDLVSALQWRHRFGERTSGDLKYTGWTGYFDRNPAVLRPAFVDLATGQLEGSAGVFSHNDRARHQLNASLSRYAEAFGKHQFRFGLEIERSRAGYRVGYVDDVYLLGLGGVPLFAYSYGYEVSAHTGRESLYAQDSWQVSSRFTVNPGLRLDFIRGSSPEIGRLYDVRNVQPRLGLAWDLKGDGTWVARAHYGRYHEAALTEIWRRAAPGYRERVFYSILEGEPLARRPLLNLSRSYDVDADLSHPSVHEIVAGFEGVFFRGVRLQVTGLWRKLVDPVATLAPDERWTASTATDPLTGQPLTVYLPGDVTPNASHHLITNPDGSRYLAPDGREIGVASAARGHGALIVSLSRALADRWQARASYVLSRSDGDLDALITQATRSRFGRYDDANSALSGARGELNTSRRHELKLMASYEVPKADVTVAGVLQVLSGQHWTPLQVRDYSDARPVYVLLLEPRGSRTLPMQTTLDLRIEKAVRLGAGRIGAFVDVTNALDSRTVTDVNACAAPLPGTPDEQARRVRCPDLPLGAPLEVLAGRQVAFGLRYSF